MDWTKTSLQQRAAAAMAYAKLSEAELVRGCQELLGEGCVDQRKINRVITPKSVVKNSAFVPVIAEVTGVRSVWLQWGVGHMLTAQTNSQNRKTERNQLLTLVAELTDELKESEAAHPEASTAS